MQAIGWNDQKWLESCVEFSHVARRGNVGNILQHAICTIVTVGGWVGGHGSGWELLVGAFFGGWLI